MTRAYDAVLLIAFGGPSSMDEVRPFLANVLRGRSVPPERVEEVVRHYEVIGGRSPLNELTFRQADALRRLLKAEGPALPVYVGMRNWNPYLHEALGEMKQAGRKRVIGVILAPQQSDASWGRYQRDVGEARERVGAEAPSVEFARAWYAHPLFIDAMAARVGDALRMLPAHGHSADTRVVFTAHSIPCSLAGESPYVAQLTEGADLVAARLGLTNYTLAYQSRSGNPREPWLEPDIGEVVRREAARGVHELVIVPLGFVCDHVEVLYDLDVEVKGIAEKLGVRFVRALSVNDHPSFIRMMAEVVREHVASAARPADAEARRPGLGR